MWILERDWQMCIYLATDPFDQCRGMLTYCFVHWPWQLLFIACNLAKSLQSTKEYTYKKDVNKQICLSCGLPGALVLSTMIY